MRIHHVLLIGLALVFATGCGSSKKAPAAGAGAQVSAGTTAQAPNGAPLLGSGTVLETMDAGGYTYVNVDLGGTTLWAAGPPVPVKVGETVTLSGGMAMREFHSKTLDRTFPVIYFVGSITPGAGAPRGAGGMRAMPAGHGTGKPAATTAVASVEPIADGQTVEQIVTGAAEWSGKEIVVRGQVVKFNGGILGTNWIHIQDGTGSAGTNDLTVTTDATVAVGDIVVVRGAVATDRDFGSGFSYSVIIENAAVTKE